MCASSSGVVRRSLNSSLSTCRCQPSQGITAPRHIVHWRLNSRGGARDVHITSCADEAVLRVSKKIVPTITYSMEHSTICPAGSKYWSTLQRACHVRAGAICTLARPTLGCGRPRTSFTQEPLRRRQPYAAELASPASRIWVPSTDLRRRFLHQGFDDESVAVMPNLGMRKSAGELQEAAKRTPPQLRDRVLFIGRLSKEKGVRLLPRLGADGDLTERLLCIGDGYLREWLAPQLGERLLSSIDQAGVSGVLMLARGLLFPSLWPEPGGIVGIDAQLFGVPVAAFGVGAPLDWPNATLMRTGDTAAMVEWASTLARPEPRDTTAGCRSSPGILAGCRRAGRNITLRVRRRSCVVGRCRRPRSEGAGPLTCPRL